ncbi:hypothetical protein [Patulibacter americanus]|uniref:hypothetical protein n=1 Tax=Patulibacter americanus TaxID=588672 RepID=UPI0012FCD4E3|nr:hypothetical protein [Patulibacter americanus]
MYTAYDRLDPDASPGQLHVRRLAEEAQSVDAFCALMQRDRPLLHGDKVLGRPDTTTVCERAYLTWQQRRGDTAQEDGVLQERHAAYVGERGDEPHGGTLATLLAPDGDEPPLATKILFSLFHDGPDPTVMGAKRLGGRVFPEEGVVVCDGGSQRVAAHVAGGVLLTPELGGEWSVIRTTADRELLDALRLFTEVVDPDGLLVPQPADDVEAVRGQLVAMAGQFEDLFVRRLRMPESTRAELYHRPLDTTLERLSDEIDRLVAQVRRESRPRRRLIRRG